MKISRVLAISLLVLSSFAATSAVPSKTELETMYDKAFREFDANHYDEALKALDAIDARQPDLAESKNLRGVVLMRKGDYAKAEVALRKALEIEPKFWNASFNLAEIPFLKKNWAEARNRFEALVAGKSDEMKGETSLLIQYKILLTFVLEGKENMVDWIVNKFEGEKDSPALYYSNAAIALQRNNQKEAKDWMDAADKHYPPSLNKLFAESFYEIGWMEKPAGDTRAAIEITSTSERAARMKADAQANFERAERAFQQRDFAGALKFLDLSDEGAPNQAPSLNLRGEVLMEEKKFDEAEDAFRQAFAIDPKFREAQYNLAQIPFKKQDYAKARERLEVLFGETPGGEKNQAAQLIKYKIFMTLLLEGRDADAQKMMDQFKFTGDTPALYYAQAAWAFQHKKTDEGNDWIKSARKIYSPALNIVFADAFYDLGWLQQAEGSAPPTTSLAQAASAAAPAGPTPEMRFGGADSVPAPVATGTQPADTALAAAAAATPAAVAVTSAPISSETAAANPAASPLAALTASASPAMVAQTAPAVAAASSPAQTVVEKTGAPATAASTPASVVSSGSAVTPAATAMEPARIREYSQPTFAEMVDRMSDRRTLLVGGLLLGGVGILGWLVFQQMRRHVPGASLLESSLPMTEPRFRGAAPGAGEERRVSREQLEAGPPKLSLQLKASEPAVRKAVLPSGNLGQRSGSPELGKPAGISANGPAGSVSEVRPAIARVEPPAAKIPVLPAPLPDELQKPPAAKPPVREEKEVSRPAPSPPAFLPAAMPARAAAAPPPAIIPQPKGPVVEPKQLAIAAEAKPPVALVSAPPLQREEPVGQGQPVPQLTSTTPPPPSKPEPVVPAHFDPTITAFAALAGTQSAVQSSVETPLITSKIPSSEPNKPPSTTPAIMPESTTITALNEPRLTPSMGGGDRQETQIIGGNHGSSAAPASIQPAGALQTAVQLTFSLEIASLQLTPNFKMGSLQLKPISKIVSMRLAPSAQPQPAMNLQVTFELANTHLGAGASIGTVRLTPSTAQRPTPLTSPSFEISGLQLVSSAAASPVQLTPVQQGQASVLMTASFQIATVEFSPSFEIASVVLNSTSKNVAVQLPGAGPSSIEGAPVFEIGNVQLGSNNEIGMIQLNPLGSSGRRG